MQGPTRGRTSRSEGAQRAPSGKIHFERLVLFGVGANLTNHIADGAGLDPDKQQLLRRLKAGESTLTKVRREKNDLQDANTKLGVKLKDVRGQLSDSMKENQRLRRGIFSKCLNELLKKRVRRGSRLTE